MKKGVRRVRAPDQPLQAHALELVGDGAEALAFAKRLADEKRPSVTSVQAVSVGRPHEIQNTVGRLLIFVVARRDGRGLEIGGDLMHSCWYRVLEQAVNYVAFRTAGHDCEIRLVSGKGDVTHAVLIPSDGRKMTLY